jgi:hypothetical protein
MTPIGIGRKNTEAMTASVLRKPELLRRFPRVVDELNACIMHVRRDDGWSIEDIDLKQAVALPVAGEA